MTTRHGAVTLLIVVALAALGACDDASYDLEIEVRADLAAATDFGVTPGDPIPDAEIEVTGPDGSDDILDAVSDETGKATVELPGEGSYEVFITAPTNDPLCTWLGGTTVTVEEESTTVLIDDLMVACQ